MAKNMQKKYQKTTLGEFEYAFRPGNPLIVFLNCFGDFDTEQNFSKVIKKLPTNYGVFAPDYLNSGFSGKSLKSYTIHDEAIKLVKIINDLNAKDVIVVAHSIGGVYAIHMLDKIKNLRAFVAIEPTTREIILNPPKEQVYLAHKHDNPEQFIHDKIDELFTKSEAEDFWNTTIKNGERFDDEAAQNLTKAMEKDDFWHSEQRVSNEFPVIIITEAYRQKEYQRSEYFNQNAETKIVPMGSFHYIQWEFPTEIANITRGAS